MLMESKQPQIQFIHKEPLSSNSFYSNIILEDILYDPIKNKEVRDEMKQNRYSKECIKGNVSLVLFSVENGIEKYIGQVQGDVYNIKRMKLLNVPMEKYLGTRYLNQIDWCNKSSLIKGNLFVIHRLYLINQYNNANILKELYRQLPTEIELGTGIHVEWIYNLSTSENDSPSGTARLHYILGTMRNRSYSYNMR